MGIASIVALTLFLGYPSVEEIGQAHRISAEMIESAHVIVRLKLHADRSKQTSLRLPDPCRGGEYWRKPGLVRMREEYAEGQTDWLLKNGVSYASSKSTGDAGQAGYAAGNRRAERASHVLDVWAHALFSLDRLPIHEYFTKYRDRLSVTAEVLDGAKCVVVTADHRPQKCKLQFWLDPAINHLVRAIRTIEDDGSVFESVITRFREHHAGVYFPERGITRYQPAPGKNQRPWEQESTFVAEINVPISDDIFQIRYHPGVTFVDEINGSAYRVDADGKPIGAATPLAVNPIESPPAEIGTQTRLEDTDGTPWWWYASILFAASAVVAIIVLYVKRNRP